ncbi:MAG: hypothetical protein IKY52_00115 [Clostridia bacterium]|nr:hypothetical protein [Clostridia bacterium]
MTLIEFFDKVPTDNIIAALSLKPRHIVFLGTDREKISSLLPHIRRILSARGVKSSLTMRIIDRDDLSGILEAMGSVLEKEDEFVFDFTGGDDTALVALGMVFRMADRRAGVFRMSCESRKGILYKIPLSGGTFEAVPYDGTLPENPVYLTLQENIQLYRGQVREEMIGTNTRAGHPFTADIYRELNRMWRLCQTDCSFWNSQVGKLGGALRVLPDDKSMYTLSGNMRGLEDSFLASLTDGGFLRMEQHGKGGLWYCTFPDPYVRDCLTKAGTLLEYKTYMTALYWPDGTGSSPYTDGGAGVVIDWEEAVQKGKTQPKHSKNNSYEKKKSHQPVITRNEIDTLLMRGLVPVFISCKNGEVDTDELYKLSTVAGRFGSRYAKRALAVTSYFDKDDRNYAGDGTVNYMRSRAKDMNITLLENVHRMSDREFAEALHRLSEPKTEE